MKASERKKIMILGSTGSVGEQAVDVALKSNAEVIGLSADSNVKRIEEQARMLGVKYCSMANKRAADELRIKLADTDIKVFSGNDGICGMISEEKCDIILNSIIGEAGLKPTLAAIETGARLALANKESLVVAGEIVMQNARGNNVEIIPVDSEHSAIFQCLRGNTGQRIKKILLTASGGPFYGYSEEELKKITVEQALAHPTWKMGAKITIDSATLMNKGFEVIEAVHLFDVRPENIEVVVQRESIIHSMVEYIDNSIIAQLSVPDMRLCVQYALTYPERSDAVIGELDLFKLGALHFSKPDTDTFQLLSCAVNAIKAGGALPAVVNAANEIAVAYFLSGKISFYDIFNCVTETVAVLKNAVSAHTLSEILEYDGEARHIAESILNQKKNF